MICGNVLFIMFYIHFLFVLFYFFIFFCAFDVIYVMIDKPKISWFIFFYRFSIIKTLVMVYCFSPDAHFFCLNIVFRPMDMCFFGGHKHLTIISHTRKYWFERLWYAFYVSVDERVTHFILFCIVRFMVEYLCQMMMNWKLMYDFIICAARIQFQTFGYAYNFIWNLYFLWMTYLV